MVVVVPGSGVPPPPPPGVGAWATNTVTIPVVTVLPSGGSMSVIVPGGASPVTGSWTTRAEAFGRESRRSSRPLSAPRPRRISPGTGARRRSARSRSEAMRLTSSTCSQPRASAAEATPPLWHSRTPRPATPIELVPRWPRRAEFPRTADGSGGVRGLSYSRRTDPPRGRVGFRARGGRRQNGRRRVGRVVRRPPRRHAHQATTDRRLAQSTRHRLTRGEVRLQLHRVTASNEGSAARRVGS